MTNLDNKQLFTFGFLLAFFVYCISPVITPSDSRYNSHTAYSIIKNGDSNIDEIVADDSDYRVETVNKHRYSYFPIWSAILLIPCVLVADVLMEPAFDQIPLLEVKIRQVIGGRIPLSEPMKTYELYPIYELLTAALISALAVGLMGLLARRHLPLNQSILIMLLFAFATPMWSTVSRAMWMHAPSILTLTATLLCIDRAATRPKAIIYAGSFVALAYMFRPTNAIAVMCVSVYVFVFYRQYFLHFLLAALPFAIIYFGYNISIYGHLISSYGNAGRLSLHPGFTDALLGNWFSPARGMLIYSPIFCWALYSFWKHRDSRVLNLCSVIIILHWVTISLYPHWWGGYSYGPRFFSDMIPLFCYGLVIFFKHNSINNLATKIIFTTALCFSLITHGNGGTNMDAFWWNSRPSSIDEHPERLWDWMDPQFLRFSTDQGT